MHLDFTRTRFLHLPVETQHKKCSELIRSLFKLILESEKKKHLAAYQDMCEWMGEKPILELSFKELSDRFHYHLQKARLAKKEHHLLPQIRKGDKSDASPLWPINIYLDHIRSAHNVGSILRTVEAFSLGTLYFSEQTPFIDNKQVQDTAMGTEKWLTCKQGVPLSELKEPIILLETSDEAISLNDYIFPESFTLVVGNEEYGCSDNAIAQANILIEIPLRGRKNSLNVANAFAIVANEIARQKNNSL